MIDITEKKVPHLFRNKYLRNAGSGSVNTSIQSPGQSTPGASVDIVKSDSATVPTDTNVLSALRTLLEIRSRIIASADTETALSEENTLSSFRIIAEIEAGIAEALEAIDVLYLSKTKADKAAEAITFLKGLFVGDNLAFINASGDAEFKNLVTRMKAKVATLEVTGAASVESIAVGKTATTVNLLVQALADIYDLNVTHVTTMFRTIIKDYVSSETFVPGLAGEGMKIHKALNGDWNLEIDNVVVRKVMTIFELVVSKIRSVNGGLVISPANGRIKSVALSVGDPVYYVLEIEGDMQFVADDLVRCQVFTSGQAKYYWVAVSSVMPNSILVLKSEFTNGVVPAVGDDLVQMGNRTNKARQGLLYLTASEDGKPRFSVMDGVNSASTVGKSKVILGCLDGMTDTDFPADFQPSGYGLYAGNVFLKGMFLLRNGKSVETEIDSAKSDAQTAKSDAQVAKNTADTAKSLADSADALLSDIANDDKLTPSEKQATKKEWESILSEKLKNDASADKYGVSKVAYNSAYATLVLYLSPLLTPITTTSNISGSTFRAKFKAYYDARAEMLNAISAKAKDLADAAQGKADEAKDKADTVTRLFQEFTVAGGVFESKINQAKTYADGKVDGLQIGGRNLALYSGSAITNDYYCVVDYELSEELIAGDTYTITLWGKLGEGKSNFGAWMGGGYTHIGYLKKTEEGKYQLCFTPPVTVSGNGRRDRIDIYSVSSEVVVTSSIYKFKLERGNKSTDWTPAPEDVAADAQAKANAAQAAAEAVAIAKANLAKTEASAYADGVVSAEEQRAINDAKAKLEEAKRDAQAKADAAKNAAISDAAGKYNTKSEVSSLISQTKNEINLSVTEKVSAVRNTAMEYANLSAKLAGAKMLRRDPTFKEGNNGISVYNNSSNGTVVINRTGVNPDNPTDSGYQLAITSNGYSNQPGRGGFYFGNHVHIYGEYICKFIAWIPVGSNVCFASNSLGNGGFQKWLTPTAGQGKWAEYVSYVRGGTADTSSTNFYYLDGGAEILTWWLCYATVFECSSSESDYIISDTSSKLQVLSNEISSKVSNTTFNALGTRVSAAESSITQQAGQIASKVSNDTFNALGNRVSSAETTITQHTNQISLKASQSDVTALGNRVSTAEFKLDPSQIWLGIKGNVQAAVPNYTKQIDTRTLDSNKYYLVTIGMSVVIPYTITVRRNLEGSWGVPPYSTHSDGFSVLCKWQCNGSGWGCIAPQRTILTFTHAYSTVCPVGNISQINESSEEYIYIRGGSMYEVQVDGISSTPITLHTTTHTPRPDYPHTARPGVIDSVSAPVVDLDTKVTEEQVKAGIGITENGLTVFGKFIDFTGRVTFTSMSADAQNRITAAQNAANAANGAAGSAQNTANDAVNKANAAQGTANTGVANASAAQGTANDAWNRANNAQTSANNVDSALGSLRNSLGGLAYDNAVTLAKLDSTIIEGGYFKTNLINARAIVTGALIAEAINATNISATNLTITGNSIIAGLRVSGNSLSNVGHDNDAYIILRNNPEGTFAGIGANVYNDLTYTNRVVARFACEGNRGGMSNTALMLKASGSSRDNIALDMTGRIKTDGSFGKTFTVDTFEDWISGRNKVTYKYVNGILVDYWYR